MESLIVYVDVIWLLNWLFDCLLLYWTAIILKRRVPYWRLLAGGFIGSLIIALAFTSYASWIDNIYMKFIFSIFMVLTVFGFIRIKTFIKSLATLYFITFLAGGILIGLHYLFSFHVAELTASSQFRINRFGDPMSWMFVVIGFPLAWQFSKRTLDGIEMTKIHYEQLVTISIEILDYKAEFQGLIDSGNQLYDPISRSPVMIVSIFGKESEFPPNLLPLFENPDKLMDLDSLSDYRLADRIRVIPYKVVGQSHQILTAIKPDVLTVIKEDKIYQVKSGLVSFTMQQLSAENSYQCIVHPKMLTGLSATSVS